MNEEVKNEFIKYTSKYQDKNCIYKVEHTFRVVDFSLKIADDLKFNEEEIFTVYLCSLLHDIGRFEQMKKYNTFVDRDSKYHGDIGVEVLLNNNLIDNFCKDKFNRNLVLKTCKYHGTLKILDSLSDKEKEIINIVRDSDKIDILNNAYLGNIKLDIGCDEVSEKVRDNFYSHNLIDMKNKISKVDRFIVWLAFVYDFNFKYTFSYLKKSKLMDKLILKYINMTPNENTKKELKKMGKEINNYIDERLS